MVKLKHLLSVAMKFVADNPTLRFGYYAGAICAVICAEHELHNKEKEPDEKCE